MTCMKTKDEATSAGNPSRSDWSSRLPLSNVKIPFPIRVLQTKEGELYVLVNKAGSSGPRMKQAQWTKMIGPLEAGKPLKEQLEGVGPLMKVEQTREEMKQAMDGWNSKAKGAFEASVDLSDLLNNEAQALAAIKSSDRDALERICPNPYLMRRTIAD